MAKAPEGVNVVVHLDWYFPCLVEFAYTIRACDLHRFMRRRSVQSSAERRYKLASVMLLRADLLFED